VGETHTPNPSAEEIMKKTQFVHLHNHTEYSLGDGIMKIVDESGNPSEFIRTVLREGMPAVAITDHGNLFGAIEFYSACHSMGIKPIVGCEMFMVRGPRTEECGLPQDKFHITVLARDCEGYQNLIICSTIKQFNQCNGVESQLNAQEYRPPIS